MGFWHVLLGIEGGSPVAEATTTNSATTPGLGYSLGLLMARGLEESERQ